MRSRFQNKLAELLKREAGACEDICKATGAYPQCSGCTNFVMPDATPGVMTWDEMFTRMDDLVDWGRDQLKQMRKLQSMALPQINRTVAEPAVHETHAAVVGSTSPEKKPDQPSAPVVKR